MNGNSDRLIVVRFKKKRLTLNDGPMAFLPRQERSLRSRISRLALATPYLQKPWEMATPQGLASNAALEE